MNNLMVQEEVRNIISTSNAHYIFNILFYFDEYFDRDKEMLLYIYSELIRETKLIPDTVTLIHKVCEYNKKIMFVGYEKDILFEKQIASVQDMTPSERIDFYDRVNIESQTLLARIYMVSINSTADSIRSILDENKLCYIDNHASSYIVSCGYTIEGTYCVLKNDSQKFLIPSLHLENYSFLSDFMTADEILNTKLIKRRY